MDPLPPRSEPAAEMSSHAPSSGSSSASSGSRRTALWGLSLCVLAALGYSAVNACLRELTIDCNRVWVIFIKELVTVVVIGPWLAWHAWHGRRLLPGGYVLLALALAGLLTQLGANLPILWAFSIIGLAVALPVMSGTNLVATAVLGRVFLSERVSRQTVLAIGLLIVSVAFLGVAAPEASKAIRAGAESSSEASIEATEAKAITHWKSASLAVGAACMAGIVYAILVVVIRRNVTGDTPTTAVVFIITLMGAISLGPWLAVHEGLDTLTEIPLPKLGLMLFAGLLNLLAFLAITNGLQFTRAAHANMIMTSQVAIGATIGMTFFAEPASVWMFLGVGLTIGGMILIGRQVRTEPETPETPV